MKCDKCGCDIDPTTCWCGEEMDGHGYFDNHLGIPMGCGCFFPKKPKTELDIGDEMEYKQ